MAKMQINLPDDLMEKLSKLQGQVLDDACEKALEAAGKIVLGETRRRLQASIGKDLKSEPRSTGELLDSLGLSPVNIDDNGTHNVKVGFDEPRSHQSKAKRKRSYNESTNAMIANVLENGKHGQAPRPFIKPAAAKTKKAALAEMERVVTEAIENA